MTTPESNAATVRKPSLKERQRQLREDAILDAAEEMLISKGLAGMTLDDLSAEVGISKPTLYQHFRSKEEVIAGMMTRALRGASRKLHELSASLPPVEALRALIEWIVKESSECQCGAVTDLCVAISLIAQAPIRDAESKLSTEIEHLVDLAQQDGSVSTEIPPMLVSRTLLSVAKDRSYFDLITAGRTDIPTIQRSIVRMLLGV